MATARYGAALDQVKYAIDYVAGLRIERHGGTAKWQRSKLTIISHSSSMIEMDTMVTIGLCVKTGTKVVKTAHSNLIFSF
jgi:chitinase